LLLNFSFSSQAFWFYAALGVLLLLSSLRDVGEQDYFVHSLVLIPPEVLVPNLAVKVARQSFNNSATKCQYRLSTIPRAHHRQTPKRLQFIHPD